MNRSEILAAVAAESGLELAHLAIPSKNPKLAHWRQVAIYIHRESRNVAGRQLSSPVLARIWAIHHTSVLYAHGRIARQLEERDYRAMERVSAVRRRLSGV